MRDEASDDFLVFQNPKRIFYVTDDQAELNEALRALNSPGRFVSGRDTTQADTYFAGAVAYDTYNDAFKILDSSVDAAAASVEASPILIGGLFDEPYRLPASELLSKYDEPLWPVQSVRLEISRHSCYDCIEKIRENILNGLVYQANFTFPVRFSYTGDVATLFAYLYQEQPAAFASALFYSRGDLNFALLSVSPELFFRIYDGVIHCRPMKGTAPRSGDAASDRKSVQYLQTSEKERAENAMIVDLIRNDLGQICKFGSVEVNHLFRIQELPTVFQMTTDVKGQLKKGIQQSDIFDSIFPSGSVTGAPKRAAVKLLHDLEKKGRGFYTGTLGYTNGQNSCFNVAIRTVQIRNQEGSISVGSGITYDSDAKSEFRECLDKLTFFRKAIIRKHNQHTGDFYLYETILFRQEQSRGYWLLERHLQRLQQSARYFRVRCPMTRIRKRLQRLEYLLRLRQLSKQAIRVHLRLQQNGKIKIILHEVKSSGRNVTIELSQAPALSILPFLNHKTSTARAFYECHKAKTADDCLFINEQGEITETTMYSVFCRIDGQWVTPKLSCGVLAGIMRGRLIERYRIAEVSITADDVRHASAIILANSVRGLRRAVLIENDN